MPAKVCAVGDIMLGDSAICVGFGFASRHDAQGLRTVLSKVRPILADADIGFGNLETVLSDRGLKTDSLSSRQMRGQPAYASVLRDVGFNVLNIANNHAMQHGDGPFSDTVQALQKAGIHVCGLRGVDGWCSQPVVMRARAVTVGILGYCLRPRQYASATPPFAEGTPEDLRADVARLKSTVDHVIVSLHWGEEFVREPSESEVALARSLVDAGASIIVGHHPHVVRPVERYRNGVIGYSLGNFISDMVWLRELRAGTMLRCELSAIEIVAASTVGTRIERDFAPIPIDTTMAIGDECRSDGLPEVLYVANIRRTLTRQRIAAYGYAIRHLLKYPRTIVVQMLYATARNKLAVFRNR